MITITINGVEIRTADTIEVRSGDRLLLTIKPNGIMERGEGWKASDMWINRAFLGELCGHRECPFNAPVQRS